MRVNAKTALAAFERGAYARPAESVWTDGTTLFSYGTAIATRTVGGGIVLNRTQYSRTTSTHQTALAVAFGVRAVAVTGIRQGATRDDLVRAAGTLEAVSEHVHTNY